MKTADTSAVVAAFASWHEKHDAVLRVLDGAVRLIEHCALETYSVLTRLPAPHRAPAELVTQFLRERFSAPYLRLPAGAYRAFLQHLPERQVMGGAAYDALVAATAAHAGATLISCDARAAPLYERYGVQTRLL